MFVVGSSAEKLDNLNINFNLVNVEIDKLTFLPYVEKEFLHKSLSNAIEEVEKEINLRPEKLTNLNQLLLLVPSDHIRKEEYESRVKNLNNLYYISNELDMMGKNEGELGEVQESKINQLAALLKVTYHGPLRNLLENKLMRIKSALQSHPKEIVDEDNLFTLINSSKSAEEIEEIFCEASFEEYINLGNIGRKKISQQFFEGDKSYKSSKEVIDCLNRLVDQFKSNSKVILKEEREFTCQMLNETLNAKDFELL